VRKCWEPSGQTTATGQAVVRSGQVAAAFGRIPVRIAKGREAGRREEGRKRKRQPENLTFADYVGTYTRRDRVPVGFLLTTSVIHIAPPPLERATHSNFDLTTASDPASLCFTLPRKGSLPPRRFRLRVRYLPGDSSIKPLYPQYSGFQLAPMTPHASPVS